MKRITIVLFTGALFLAQVAAGQTKINPRATKLGTQRPKEDPDSKQTVPVDKEKPEEALGRALNAHGGQQALKFVLDSVSEGKLTFFTAKGAANTIDVTVSRKGGTRIQRVLKRPEGETRQGTDGTSTWESANGMTMLAPRGLAASYIESQTVRSVENLLDFQSKGSTLQDRGKRNSSKVVEVQAPVPGKSARKTQYFIDDTTSRVTRIQWAIRDAKDVFGHEAASTESYVYSDFRQIDGVLTPFRIERYIDALKIEETQFTSVRYNTALKDDVFKP
jgi:hypothetical protein